MDPLASLFGSPLRLKLMRLFLFNEELCDVTAAIAKRAASTPAATQAELRRLERIGLVRRKNCTVVGANGKKKKAKGWALNTRFRYATSLRVFLLNTNPLHSKSIAQNIAKAGPVKLIIISGIFLQNWESRLDLLIVGDNIKEAKLASAVKFLESLLGHELRYAVFPTREFEYRLNIYDRLLRDVLDFEHEVVLNKLPNKVFPQQAK